MPASVYLFRTLAWLLVSACAADEPEVKRFEFQQVHMGTQFRIALYASDEPAAVAASRAAFDRIAALDAMLSDYRDDSELMRLAAKSGGPPVEVSRELFVVLARSQQLVHASDGAFDVTAGPLVRLWRRARRQKQLPDSERLAKALELVGRDKMKLDEAARTVELTKPGIQLDVGGIAKGYAADEAIAALKSRGVSRALVAASGDIVVSDPPPGERGWTIGIGPLDAPDKTPSRFLLLANAAVSTSGDAEQHVEIAGTRYSHIVDPKTGIGLTGRSSVTVVAPTGITADGLATAASVLGPERGIKLIESTDGAAALIVRVGDNGDETFESARFKKLPRGEPKRAVSEPPR